MINSSRTSFLHRLARLYGIKTAYYDVTHSWRSASLESLLAVLRGLGSPVNSLEDVPSAWREHRQTLWQRCLEPVSVAWNGEPLLIEVRLPARIADARLAGHLRLETGEQLSWEWYGKEQPVLKTAEVEGVQYVVKQLPLPSGLPLGYHRFILEVPGGPAETFIIAAPLKAYAPPKGLGDRGWGVFIPLYALYGDGSWGSGNFSDLEALLTWVAGMGGSALATLPLLPTFLDEPFEPSPYTPVSRLLWNEFYLDIDRVSELQKCPQAQAILSSSAFQAEIEARRSSSLVDYRALMALKRRVLEELSQCCFAEGSERLESLQRFAETHPVVEDYARFRATVESRHTSWPSWPQPLREGVLKDGDYDEARKRYHLYGQWLAHQQVQALSGKAREQGVGLHLDLPLGVHPEGYDVWRNQGLFVQEASAGAPPDIIFTRGQNWKFLPLHPERLRQQGYSYYIACLRHHLQHAGMLRIDHVMGFHRLFWIPKGMEASQGLYVRYRAEEFYAILALESHRNRAVIVGEDLGMVPPEVRPAMSRHGLYRMYIVNYELASNPERALRAVPPKVVASINTHDMSPFAAFWEDRDIQDRGGLGLLGEVDAQREMEHRRAIKEALVSFLQRKGWLGESGAGSQAVLRAVLAFLSASPARVVLVNLEDLWQEVLPQNIPGTVEEAPNWRRKARYTHDVFCRLPQVVDTLREVNRIRKRGTI